MKKVFLFGIFNTLVLINFASARKDCGLMPAKNDTEIQSTAAKSKIFNPSVYVDVTLALLLVGVRYLVFKRD